MTLETMPVETEAEGFNLLSITDREVYYGVKERVYEGELPKDTFLRLGCIGHLQKDETGELIMRQVLHELHNHHNEPQKMNSTTRQLVFGKLPGVLLDWNGSNFVDYLRAQPEMYYRKGDLVEVIRERRLREGSAIDEPLFDTRLRKEISVCRGLAHCVWRGLVREARPEWVDNRNLEAYYQPAISESPTFELDQTLMRRRIVSVTVFSDSILNSLYERAGDVGVSGVGRVGLTDLRTLLAEERPELL